ncbi:peroxiredoxin-like family protein [Frigidibacter sp. MR17.24]|uniref:peroxiredoxin-like family protein n=1 Tax=Frigidibacter sp. MR17.24 TaxID=3127345 RepID=UPI003012AD45
MTDDPLGPRLDAARDPEWEPAYDACVARLNRAGAGAGAPRTGMVMPDFALPDVTGRLTTLGAAMAGRPTVLSFNRGDWCPFCSAEIGAWQRHEAALAASGAAFVIVTPEQNGIGQGLAALGPAQATVLCDADLGLAMRLGLAVAVPLDLLAAYRASGFDLAGAYGGFDHLIPVPATFVLAPDRSIRFAFVDPDFRNRAEPEAVLAVLRKAD